MDFIAPATGQYQIGVYKYSANETSNNLGIAWVKDATYLPDLRNQGGWTSEFLLHNNGAVGRNVTVHYYNADGSPTPIVSDTCGLGPNQWCTIPAASEIGGLYRIPPGTTGSAIVGGGEDVSVVVYSGSSNTTDAYNGIAASSSCNSGWNQIGAALYAPVIMNNYYDWHTELVLANANSSSTTANVAYYQNGWNVRTDTFQLAANGQITTNYSAAGLYSARITSAQPVAAIVRERNSSGTIYYNYNSLSASAATTAYAPLIMNNYYGWDTSLNVQNTSVNWANISIEYHRGDGSQVRLPHADTLPPYSAHTYWSPNEGLPAGFIGSVRVTSDQPVAVVVNQSSPHGGAQTRGMSYAGALNGSALVVLPDVLNHFGGEDWVTSVNVQSLSGLDTNVTLTYAGQSLTKSLKANGYTLFYVPNDWGTGGLRGPATVSAGQPIAVVVNHASAANPGADFARVYNGVCR